MKIAKYPKLTELKKFMYRRNVSYRKAADEIHISLDAINNKMNGYTDFSKSEMIALAKLLKMTETEFIKAFMIDLRND